MNRGELDRDVVDGVVVDGDVVNSDVVDSSVVDRDAAVIFLHLPKTGGSTLAHVLERTFSEEKRFHLQVPRFQEWDDLPAADRARLRCVYGHLPFGIHEMLPRPARYLTFLRDPVERFLSDYYYVRERPEHPAHARLHEEGWAVEEYAHKVEANAMTLWLASDVERARTGRLGVVDDASLVLARKRLEQDVAVVGLVEHFDESWLMAAAHFGWPMVRYPRINVSSGRPRASDLTPEVRTILEERLRYDRALYADAVAKWERQRSELAISRGARWWHQSTNLIYGILHRGTSRWREARSRAQAPVSESS